MDITDTTGTLPAPPPGGVLWDTAGDVRMLLALPSALLLQVAHPAVGAGVDAYSVFRTDPWGRAERSLRSAQLWVYGGQDAAAEARRLRRLHAAIRGTDTRGRPYRALDPALYGWVHATGFPVQRHAWRYLGRPLTPAAERELYEQWRQVGLLLGLRDDQLPRSADEFQPYWLRMLGELEPTVVVRELLDVHAPVPAPPRLRAAWPLLRPPLLRLRRFLTVGLLPPEARTALGLPWTSRQERRLRRLGAAARTVAPLLPERLRYLPLAHRARRAHDAHR